MFLLDNKIPILAFSLKDTKPNVGINLFLFGFMCHHMPTQMATKDTVCAQNVLNMKYEPNKRFCFIVSMTLLSIYKKQPKKLKDALDKLKESGE
jgi:hypothetical protein